MSEAVPQSKRVTASRNKLRSTCCRKTSVTRPMRRLLQIVYDTKDSQARKNTSARGERFADTSSRATYKGESENPSKETAHRELKVTNPEDTPRISATLSQVAISRSDTGAAITVVRTSRYRESGETSMLLGRFLASDWATDGTHAGLETEVRTPSTEIQPSRVRAYLGDVDSNNPLGSCHIGAIFF